MNKFGIIVYEARKQQNLTQQALSELANCSVKTVSHLETGKGTNSLTLEHILNALNIPVR